MAKTSAKARKEARALEQKKQQERLVMLAVIGIAMIGIGLLVFTGGGGVPYEDRFDLDPILGDPNAPITIVQYSAYGCPACREWHRLGIIDDILEAYPGTVNFTFRDMPIIMPAYSQWSAEVAQCALDQGNDQYWTFHNAMYDFADMGVSTQADLIDMGGQLGLDEAALTACVEVDTHVDTVRYDLTRGRELGINSVPVFFVNGERVFNATPDILQDAIERAIRDL